MKRLLAMVMVSLFVVGCSQSEESKEEMDKIARIRVAKESIQKTLVDPKSAEYKDIYVHKNREGVKAVCGYVNAKNRLGGYAGYEPFLAVGSIAATKSQGGKEFAEAWNTYCEG
ncbi:hypothetical protein MMG00_12260 [Ignatzschineria rhizosphaerae]|uniref:DUF4156 domain-containing protein n=1 Tax=Ignatzschineria rhizosphaerae TaxID=2923279 RepID=A0ABY3X2N2_9GAMM|nr:hypothetical protein [Ignatzschineria rhizosphaerae]UNM95959.1 hypothetical protein MMG00_12260 [Ignatzschineria rhizosphaerae]